MISYHLSYHMLFISDFSSDDGPSNRNEAVKNWILNCPKFEQQVIEEKNGDTLTVLSSAGVFTGKYYSIFMSAR